MKKKREKNENKNIKKLYIYIIHGISIYSNSNFLKNVKNLLYIIIIIVVVVCCYSTFFLSSNINSYEEKHT
jgi:hypothetical protein